MLLDRVLSYQTGYGDAACDDDADDDGDDAAAVDDDAAGGDDADADGDVAADGGGDDADDVGADDGVEGCQDDDVFCCQARHTSRNFRSAWLKASSKRQFSRRLCLGARKFAATSPPNRWRLRVSGRGCTVDTEG